MRGFVESCRRKAKSNVKERTTQKNQEVYTLHSLRSDSSIIPPSRQEHTKERRKTPILTSCSFLCVADVDLSLQITALRLAREANTERPASVFDGLDNRPHPVFCSQCLAHTSEPATGGYLTHSITQLTNFGARELTRQTHRRGEYSDI